VLTRTKILLVTIPVVCLAGVALWRVVPPPLREQPFEGFPRGFPLSVKLASLNRDFQIISDVNHLPPSVLKFFQEPGGGRLLIANPGGKFNATDVINDASIPRRRLIFAGLSTDICFVHYEEGGIALVRRIRAFRITSTGVAEPLWTSSCFSSLKTIEELRAKLGDECN
jgi:hypothetical protein